jgi:outer membrane protein OmpA-like peptidoglycan-associated protein
MMKKQLAIPTRTLISGAILAVLSGCAVNPSTGQAEFSPTVSARFHSIFDSPDPCSDNDRNIGIAVGVLAGGVVGYMEHGVKGAVAGAAIGAGGGYLIGHVMDARRCSLYKIAQANHLRLVSAAITEAKLEQQTGGEQAASAQSQGTIGIDVQLQNAPDEFEPGSAVLTPQAHVYLSQIAQQYTPKAMLGQQSSGASAQAPHQVLIVGHTDAKDASSGVNLATLSQQRARTVAEVFAQNGVPPNSIYFQGAGDTLPIASNATVQGRAENQRVQIIDVPNTADLQRYLQLRVPNSQFFAATPTATVQPATNPTTAASGGSLSTQLAAVRQPVASEPPKPSKSEPLWQQIEDKAKRLAWEESHEHSVAPQPTAAIPPLRAESPTVSRPNLRHTEAAPQPPSQPQRAAIETHVAESTGGYNFGGVPNHGSGVAINLGDSVGHSMFSLLNTAQAAAPVILPSCLNDAPRASTLVRNLATGEALAPRFYLPGFDNNVWASNVNGNLVAITGATVPVDGGAPVPTPKVLIYKNYRGNTRQAPNFEKTVPVNVYRGADGTVYRLFVRGPAQCMDLVVPTRQFNGKAHLYYAKAGGLYQAEPGFSVQR